MRQQYIKKRYKIEKTIGEGGMGIVLLATDQKHNCQVAIKNIHPNQIDVYSVERLKREALYLSKISHPNIVRVYDFFKEKKQYYLVMEYVQGETLEEIIYSGEELSFQEKLLISYQLVSAIRTMNSQGLVHRDIKPSNILYVADGQYIKLLDLGIVKCLDSENTSNLTKTNAILGTPAYMSPEQVNGDITEKSDVFTVATVIYQLFANFKESPFLGNNNLNTMLKVSTVELTPLKDIIEKNFTHSNKLSRILQCALEKDSKKRIDIDAFFREINSIMGMHQSTHEIKIPKPHIRRSKRITNKKSASKKVIIFSLIFVFLLSLLVSLQMLNKENHSHEKFTLVMEQFSQRKFNNTWKQNELFLSEYPQSPYSKLLKSLMLYHALGVERQIYQSKKISSKWHKQIQNKRDIYSLYLQAKIYLDGIGVKKDVDRALKHALSATKKFYPLAFTCLGEIYLEQKNNSAALKALREGASMGEIEAMHQLGVLYFKGIQVEADGKMALQLLKKSFEKGNISAASSIGYIYFYGAPFISKNSGLAMKWFEIGANLENSVCLNNLAAIYLNEHGKNTKPRKSLIEIASIFRKAAKKGSHLAMRSLGNMNIRYFALPYQGLYWLIKAKNEGNNYVQNDIFNLTKDIDLLKIREQVLLENNYARYVLFYWFMVQEKQILNSFYWLIMAYHHDTQNLNIIDDIARYIEDEKIAKIIMNPNKTDKYAHVVLGFLYEKGIGFDISKKIALQHYQKAIALGEKSPKIHKKVIR